MLELAAHTCSIYLSCEVGQIHHERAVTPSKVDGLNTRALSLSLDKRLCGPFVCLWVCMLAHGNVVRLSAASVAVNGVGVVHIAPTLLVRVLCHTEAAVVTPFDTTAWHAVQGNPA